MLLGCAHVIVPVMPVRPEPSHRAEQSTQLLFGEKVDILEVNAKDWARIISSYDEYPGWCKLSQIKIVSRKENRKQTKHIITNDASKLITATGEMWLPAGSELTGIKGTKVPLQNETGSFKGKKAVIADLKATPDALKMAAMQFLYAPYQWGGRSRAGIDCSGFTQLVYKLNNHKLPRDAYQQANFGTIVDFLQASQTGDLAFFDDKDGKIIHVGMILDQNNIIHASDASGCVAIDKIDQGGIVSVVHKKRTHKLRLVKRMI